MYTPAARLLLAALAIATCFGCSGGSPMLEVHHVAMRGGALCIVAETSTVSYDLARGERFTNPRQYLLRYEVRADGSTRFVDMSRLGGARRANRVQTFFISTRGDRILRIYPNIGAAPRNGKAYPHGSIDVLGPDERPSEWRVLASWPNRPFVISASARRIILGEKHLRAIDLDTMRPIDVPHLERTWELAGVEPDPDMFLTNIDAGLDPPMAVITDDLYFVKGASSAGVGDSQIFLFGTSEGEVAKLNVGDAEHVIHSVAFDDLHAGFRWRIADREWDPEGGCVLVREAFRDDRSGEGVGPMHFAVWNYRVTPPTIARGTVDPRDGFMVRGARFKPLE